LSGRTQTIKDPLLQGSEYPVKPVSTDTPTVADIHFEAFESNKLTNSRYGPMPWHIPGQPSKIVYVGSETSFFEPVQLQNALRKREEFEAWEMAIVDGYDRRNFADVFIEIDRPLFTYTFTYKITNRSNGIVLATGRVTAFDGNAAAPKLAQRIMEEMRVARGENKRRK
jgi:hypothetical protein